MTFKKSYFDGFRYHDGMILSSYPFLRHYPKEIENYQNYKELYDTIQDVFENSELGGIMISSSNPINTGSLFLPLALKALNSAKYVTVTQDIITKEPENLPFIDREELIIDELGLEPPTIRWITEKVINHRFSKGLRTHFGTNFDFDELKKFYKAPIVHKIESMTELKVNIPTDSIFVRMNDILRIKITRKNDE